MKDLFYVERKHILSLVFLQMLLLSSFISSSHGQVDVTYQHSSLLFGIHSSGRMNVDIDGTIKNTSGFSVEYRHPIADINKSLYFSLGFIINSFGYREEHTASEYFQSIQYNFSFPLHLFYSFTPSFYTGIGASFDMPFAESNESFFQQMQFNSTSQNIRLLNINMGAGLVIGSRFRINDAMYFLVEGKARFTALKGAKSNDYWPYSEGVTPYLVGVNMGVGW